MAILLRSARAMLRYIVVQWAAWAEQQSSFGVTSRRILVGFGASLSCWKAEPTVRVRKRLNSSRLCLFLAIDTLAIDTPHI